MKKLNKFCMWTIIFFGFMLLNSKAYAVQKYTITDLGDFGGDGNSYASDINDNLQIVGAFSTSPGKTSSYIYDVPTNSHAIVNPFVNTFLRSINNSGIAVGSECPTIYCAGATSRAFYFDGSIHSPDELAGFESYFVGINTLGTKVGGSKVGAFIYDDINLEVIGNGAAWGINDNDVVVGRAQFSSFAPLHGYVYKDDNVVDIGTIDGYGDSALSHLNNEDIAVGWSNSQAIYYDSSIHPMGFLKEGNMSQADDINNAGLIVGFSNRSYDYGDISAFIYEKGVMYDFNDLIDNNFTGHLLDATAINNSGYVVGTAEIGGYRHAYLASPIPGSIYEVAPVPEPPTYLMFLLSFGIFLGYLYIKRLLIIP